MSILASLVLGALCVCTANTIPTGHHLYSTWMLDSIISRGEGIKSADGLLGGIQKEALRAAIDRSDNELQQAIWSQYHQRSVTYNLGDFFDPVKNSLAPLDRLCVGVSIMQANFDNKESRTVVAALRKSLAIQRTNFNGGWWYFTDPPPPYVPYRNLSYSDGMYGVAPFAVLYGQQHPSDVGMNISTALEQLEAIYMQAKQPSGLLVHGYDGSKVAPWANPDTGASPIVWGRSMAWYMIGLLDALEIAAREPSTLRSSEYARMSTIFRELAHANLAALSKSARATSRYGVWQVVDRPGDTNNFVEASASAMMAYVLAKGIRRGYIDPLYQPDKVVQNHDDRLQSQIQAQQQKLPTYARDLVRYLYNDVVDAFVVRNVHDQLEFFDTSAISSLHVVDPYYNYYTHRPRTNDSLIGESAFVLASLEMEYSQS